MSNCSGRFRKKRDKFSMVSNFAIRDEDLSLKAKGLYSLIQSYITIEKNADGSDFILSKEKLLYKSKEGETAFNSAWNELKGKGYIKVYKISTHMGFIYEYELLEEPDPAEDKVIEQEIPRSGKSSAGETNAGESRSRKQQSTNIDNNTREIKTIDSNTINNNNIDSTVVEEDKELPNKATKHFETALIDSIYFANAQETNDTSTFIETMNKLTSLVSKQKHDKLKQCLKLNNQQIINLFLDADKAYVNYLDTFKNPDGYIVSKLNEQLEQIN